MLIKLSIVFAAFGFIYYKFSSNTAFLNDFKYFINKSNLFTINNCIVLITLSTLNWFFEVKKWQILIAPIKPISFKASLEQSLGTLTASLITPNRIGEYGAKALYYISSLRKRVLLITLLSNILQMLTTVCFGAVGLIIFFSIFENTILKIDLRVLFISSFILLGTIIGVIAYKYNTLKLDNLLFRLKRFLRNYPLKNSFHGLLLSVLRYFTFSFQFFFILILFKVDINYLEGMMMISAMYLLASAIPSIFIFDVIVKGSVAVYLFAFIGVNELVVLSTTFLMWLLNFVLPSILGSYYVLSFKPMKASKVL
ncbi:hypothetical protein [Cognatitamlana onchidii]|uniref:hypothetical protein n=1 Tax=Cognatitamlana onchidii TaxID=2562860 RepID=UPI001F3A6AC7|nr:hypothetical protein [Algibacter onchidii]